MESTNNEEFPNKSTSATERKFSDGKKVSQNDEENENKGELHRHKKQDESEEDQNQRANDSTVKDAGGEPTDGLQQNLQESIVESNRNNDKLYTSNPNDNESLKPSQQLHEPQEGDKHDDIEKHHRFGSFTFDDDDDDDGRNRWQQRSKRLKEKEKEKEREQQQRLLTDGLNIEDDSMGRQRRSRSNRKAVENEEKKQYRRKKFSSKANDDGNIPETITLPEEVIITEPRQSNSTTDGRTIFAIDTTTNATVATFVRNRIRKLQSFIEEQKNQKCFCHWKILLFGQILSFLLSLWTSMQATLYYECNVSLPNFTNSLFYTIISLFLIPIYYSTKRKNSNNSNGHNYQDDDNEMIKRLERSQELEIKKLGYSNYGYMGLPLNAPIAFYGLIALLDVESNVCLFVALRYTTLTSVMALNVLALPTAMIASKLSMRRRYALAHFMGVILCILGIMVIFRMDHTHDQLILGGETTEAQQNTPQFNSEKYEDATSARLGMSEYSSKVKGDIIAAFGAILFGLNDVIQEHCVRYVGGSGEYLGAVGYFGLVITLFQILIFELESLSDFFSMDNNNNDTGDAMSEVLSTCSVAKGMMFILVSVFACVVRYIGTTRFLQTLHGDAALLNLSFLTASFWSIVFTVLFTSIKITTSFWVALTFIVFGHIVYEAGPSPIVDDIENIDKAGGQDDNKQSSQRDKSSQFMFTRSEINQEHPSKLSTGYDRRRASKKSFDPNFDHSASGDLLSWSDDMHP